MATNPNHPQRSYPKVTNIWAFLKAVSALEKLNHSTIQILAFRFSVSPDVLVLLINIAAKGGALYDN